jgi:hypothetical protein
VVVVESAAPPDLIVNSWPLRDEPLAATITLAVALTVSIAAGYLAGSLLFGLASAAALLLALRGWWLPVEYQLNELGVKQTIFGRGQRTPWHDWGGYRLHSRGVILLPEAVASPLDTLRGIYIPYLHQRDELVEIVERHLSDQRLVGQPQADRQSASDE